MFIAEIFESFHGEVNGHHQGRMVTFIRLSGCNLKCPYCDTKQTQDPLYGLNLTIPAILNQVNELGNKHVCLTGGEPLLDKSAVLELLNLLWWEDYLISVETNGTISISGFFRYVESFVIDYKLDQSIPFIRGNMMHLRNTDVIKFVIGNYEDYMFIREIIKGMKQECPDSEVIFAISPMAPKFTGTELAKIMLKDKIPNSVISLQIHKILDFK